MTALPRAPWRSDRYRLLDAALRCPPVGLPPGLRGDDIGAHLARYGFAPALRPSDLLEQLEWSGLRGHGGGWFGVAAKWRSIGRSRGSAVVVANGAESEPASAKDAALLVLHPHLVLDGLRYAAEAAGASEAVVWIHAGNRDAYRAVAHALAQRHNAGWREVPVRIEVAPDHYLSGESSAILAALEGGPALPRFSLEPASVSGVNGRPTLVHNVETLARIGLLARTGAAGHQNVMLVTVATEHARTVLEVEIGTPIAALVAAPEAVLVGGFGGTWYPAERLARTVVGPSIGAGILLPLDRGGCGAAVTADVLAYLAANSARQCGPCLFGLPAAAKLFAGLVDGRGSRRVRSQLGRYLAEIDGRGACHHPDGAVRIAESARHVFASDLAAHRDGRAQHDSHYGFFRPAAATG